MLVLPSECCYRLMEIMIPETQALGWPKLGSSIPREPVTVRLPFGRHSLEDHMLQRDSYSRELISGSVGW